MNIMYKSAYKMYNSGYLFSRWLCILVNDNINGITLFIKGYSFRMENPKQLLKLQRNAWKAIDLEKHMLRRLAKHTKNPLLRKPKLEFLLGYKEDHPGQSQASKGKATPVYAWTGLEGSRCLRLLDFITIGT
jgi:hypothetical protein